MLKFYDAGKVLLYLRELEAKVPVFIEVHPSLACNHNCVWCRYDHSDQELSYDYLMNLLVKYPRVRGVRITGGGEPLMNKNIITFIRECFNRGIQTGIETNGSLLNDEDIDTISRCCRYCRISLDAATPETHRALHRTDDFTVVTENIRKLRAAQVRELGLSYLVTARNVGEIPRLEDLALPVDYIHFKPLIQGIDEKTRRKAVRLIKESTYLTGLRTRYDRIEQDDVCNNRLPCRISNLIRVIGGDSREYVCCEQVYVPAFEIGIWNGDTSRCLTCRYNGYNEILESYYSNTISREFL
ncbi:MAG TPA: radical SAM protein [Syntrophales bacterium]|jgi:MoaA/NifB/PqqE/SkfB family radical SAM enzyme|nr:radical SAM protein [Syntrophales bacterium]HPC33611.1 radical SAM protein [Syntrophales bacterium]HRR48202.1 radical SAM protein [Syntrophales bacterium]